MLLDGDGRPCTPSGLRSSWRSACAAAGIVGRTFNDLRRAAVTRLAVAGCADAGIAALAGHAL